VQVTLIVAYESTDGAVLDISARPKLKTGALTWHSAGRRGHSICGGCGLPFGKRTNCADAESESTAQHSSNGRRVIGM
jgi:hypothetical protein